MTDDPMHDFTRRLFTEDDYGDNWPTAGAPPATPEPVDLVKGNHVPREGSTPDRKPNADEAYREWTRELFGHPGVEFV
ncbi:hypothetical protein [Micromonospora sp. NPDC048843]|uniref:hypothetical protein n=1 Tax=Micromonospora sp. NPDC048843 TaxID=3155389 RepID=UPI0033CD5CEC